MTQRSDYLVETDWLSEHLSDDHLRIVDIRGSVPPVPKPGASAPPSGSLGYVAGAIDYQKDHIPGAVYLDWTLDIVDVENPIEVQLAQAGPFAAAMERAGIGSEDLVVIYDTNPASTFATRLWWALRVYGHTRAVILNGGLAKWKREGYPTNDEPPSQRAVEFVVRRNPELIADVGKVVAAMSDQNATLLDARDPLEFSGASVRGDKRRGHIPGAINLPRDTLVDLETGTFRSTSELESLFSEAALSRESTIVTYCNGGVAASTVFFALAVAGYPHVTNYDGSWNEWGGRADLPVVVEDDADPDYPA